MKITKKQIDMVCALPDDALRQLIKSLAANSGFDVSGLCKTPADTEKLRSILRGMSEEDISRAAELLTKQKK